MAVDQAIGKREKQADRCMNSEPSERNGNNSFESRILVKRCVVGTVKRVEKVGAEGGREKMRRKRSSVLVQFNSCPFFLQSRSHLTSTNQ